MCTTIGFENGKDYIVGNNQDIFLKKGFAFTNHRGIKKIALLMPPEKPLEWVSKYGSISFSQCGKEFPSGGMNEEGLVVVQMTLPETVYPQIDERPGVNQMQAIQYLLDSCGRVEEAVQQFKTLRVAQASWKIHYMMFDKHGDAAVIEFINGEMIIYQGNALGLKVLSNSSYEESLHYLKADKECIEQITDSYKKNSIERFIKAVSFVSNAEEEAQSLIDHVLYTLEEVRMDENTWNMVFDIKNRTIYFAEAFRNVKYLDLGKIDFTKESMPKVLDISDNVTGDGVKIFKTYTKDLNRELVNEFFKNEVTMNVMNIRVSDELLEYFIAYPDTFI